MKKTLKIDMITEIISKINNSGDTDSLLNSIIETTRDTLECEGCSLLLYNQNEENLIFYLAHGTKSSSLISLEVPRGKGIAGYVMESGEAIIVNDAETDPRIYREIDKKIEYTTRKLMASPMISRGNLVGVLEIVNPINNEDFTIDDLNILKLLSEIAATAISNHQLLESRDSRIKEINGLYLISRQLKDATSLEEFIKIAGDCIAEILEAERLSFFLKSESSGKWKLVFHKGFPIPAENYYLELEKSEVIKKIFETGLPVIMDSTSENYYNNSENSKKYKTKSYISIPVYFENEMKGVLSVSDKRNLKNFEKHDLKLLMILVNQLSEVYRAMMAKEEQAKYLQIQRELNLANKIQRYSLVEVPKNIHDIELGLSYFSSKEIGGDFYDIIHHSSTLVSFVIADVSGKGIPAALFMEFSKTILATEISKNIGPGLSLKSAHSLLQNKFHPSMHVEVMIVQIDILRNKIRYASAGHNRQFFYNSKNDRLDVLRAKGIPIGSKIQFSDFETKELNISKNDLIVLYTDGITECINEKKEMFGEERLSKIILENKHENPIIIKEKIEIALNEFKENMDLIDDYTLFIIKI